MFATSGKSGRHHVCLFQWPATGIVASGAGRHGSAPTNSEITCTAATRRCVYAHACARVSACARVCVRDVFAIYDHNIWPMLIMIIIKIIILYFIRHTDDFPSTVTFISNIDHAQVMRWVIDTWYVQRHSTNLLKWWFCLNYTKIELGKYKWSSYLSVIPRERTSLSCMSPRTQTMITIQLMSYCPA